MDSDTLWLVAAAGGAILLFLALSGSGSGSGIRVGLKLVRTFRKAQEYAAAEATNDVLKQSAKRGAIRELRSAVGDIADSAPSAPPAPTLPPATPPNA